MTKKQWVLGIILLLAVIGGAGGVLGWSLYQPPHFYRIAQDAVADPEVRKKESKHFVQNTLHLVEEIRKVDHWSREFTDKQVNSWLVEELPRQFSEWIPTDIGEPRLQFSAGAMDIAFKYHRGRWNGIVSARLKPWVSGPNELAVEIQSVHAGLIPIPLDDLLQGISDELNQAGWTSTWRHSGESNVIVISLNRDASVDAVLESIELKPGRMEISGRRNLPSTAQATHIEHAGAIR